MSESAHTVMADKKSHHPLSANQAPPKSDGVSPGLTAKAQEPGSLQPRTEESGPSNTGTGLGAGTSVFQAFSGLHHKHLHGVPQFTNLNSILFQKHPQTTPKQ